MTPPFQGLFTALITPFKNGVVDDRAFQDFVAWQIEQGVHGLVPVGTTGESPTLSHAEQKRIVELCIEVAKGKVPVMAGTGSNSTETAIAFTKHAEAAGADAALIAAPYYNKPTQEGLYQHYRTIAEAVELPIIVYNIPGRSAVNISDETLGRLAMLPNIAGVKDATGDLARVANLREVLAREELNENFIQLSGEDMTAVGFNAMGGQGCISVTSNVAPKLCADLQNFTLAGDYAQALALQDKLARLHAAIFCETSPVPVKYAASRLGKCENVLRLPLVPASPQARMEIDAALAALSLV